MAATAPMGKRLGRYEVIRHLASGGMAEIYLAQGIGEKVVVKVITPDRAQDKKFVQMFLDEARVAATLHHPNIAQMLEVGRQDDTYFFAMEYVDGETARALLERSVGTGAPIPLALSLKIVSSVASGLHHAHERKGATGVPLQIVHRDVTPSNIMIGHDGSVKLLDFGIAQAEGRAAETQSGTIKGKFAYMSPEQCRGKNVDRRTDVFALGIVLYELTTRRRAFRTDNDFDTMDRIVRGRWVRPSQIDPNYPRELEAILTRALAIELSQRYPTAAELARAIDDFAARSGLVATTAEVAHHVRELLGTTDVELRAAPSEGTASDVELQVSPGHYEGALAGQEPTPVRGPAARIADSAALHDTLTDDDDDADAASTHRRLRPPVAALVEAAALEALEPAATGPMPVLSTARETGPLDVQVPMSVTTTGPNPTVGLADAARASAHPQPEPTGANVGGAYDELSPSGRAESSAAASALETRGAAPARTILGAAPASGNRRRPGITGPAVAPSVIDSSRGPIPPELAPKPTLKPVVAGGTSVGNAPKTEPTYLLRRQRRGLALAIVAAVVVVAIAVAAVLMLEAGKDPLPPTTPSAAPTTVR